MTVLFLEPIFKDKIWGGSKIKDNFGYDLTSNNIGECWGISAHKSGDCLVLNNKFKGHTLSSVWENYRDLFGNIEQDKFPLLTKIIDSNDNLSIQVHPNDDFAKANENGELGKTECWYILDADNDAQIVLGHNATCKEDLKFKIENKLWDDFLEIIKIKKGDFFNVPAGTIHALCKGALVLEVQQNSDTTYRLYDYDRVDNNGFLRELHIDKSLSVINFDCDEDKLDLNNYSHKNFTCTTFINNEYFTVHKLNINNKVDFEHNKPFTLYNVIDGDGELFIHNESYNLYKGSNFILLNDTCNFSFSGDLEIMVSHI